MDADDIRRVIEAHSGNLSSCAREIGVTRQALTRRLTVAVTVDVAGATTSTTLLAYAESLRAAAGVKGPRPAADAANAAADKARLVEAIAAAGGYRPAAAAMGVSPATIFRRMKRLGVTPADVAEHKARVAAAG